MTTIRFQFGQGTRLESIARQAPAPQTAAIEQDLLRMINSERARRGRSALRLSPQLARAAQLHSEDMIKKGYFSHTSQDGRDVKQRIDQTGYFSSPGIRGWAYGENIGYHSGSPTAVQMFQMWKNSPGHYANMIQPDFTEMGLGIATGSFQGKGTVAMYTLDLGKRTM